MNSHIIDIIFVVFLCFMAIFGYLKGFITRLYDFAGTIIVVFLSYFLAQPMSSLVMLYKYDTSNAVTTMIGEMINFIISFVILLVVLMIIKKVLGIACKPFLKKLMNTFSLTSFADKILGVIFSLIEGLLIAYIVLVFIVTPFTSQGIEAIQGTVLAKHVLKIVPDVSQQVIGLSENLQYMNNSTNSTESLIKMMLSAKDMNLIDDEQFQKIFVENIEEQLSKDGLTLSRSQKQQIENILKESGYNEEKIKTILSHIDEGGE